MTTLPLPVPVAEALAALKKNGFQAYLVGGVRDLILHRKPRDYDIATSALPEETRRVFAAFPQDLSGAAYGTVKVRVGALPIDITTFRREGEYRDHRHPESVSFTDRFFEDCRRRDFTVNAIGYDPETGLCDYFCGQRDLRHRLIRAIGNAGDRFEEDAVRILRAIRLASTLGFTLEEKTAEAVHAKKDLVATLSPDRIRREFCRLLCGGNVKRVLTDFSDVIGVFIPELLPAVDFDQHSPFHSHDVWQHTVHAVAAAEVRIEVRLALFFHDLSKPSCFSQDATGRGHFYGHPKKSAVLARAVMTRLGFPKTQIERVVTLVLHHDTHASKEEEIKWLLNSVGPDLFPPLLQVIRADTLAHGKWTIPRRLASLDAVARTAEKILENGDCYSLKDLAVTGDDLAERGFSGREIGEGLDLALRNVISGKWQNERGVLLEELANIFRKNR